MNCSKRTAKNIIRAKAAVYFIVYFIVYIHTVRAVRWWKNRTEIDMVVFEVPL